MNSVAILDLAVNNGPVGEFTPAALRELVDRGLVPEVHANNVIIYGEHTGDRGVWNFTGARLVDLVKYASGYERRWPVPCMPTEGLVSCLLRSRWLQRHPLLVRAPVYTGGLSGHDRL